MPRPGQACGHRFPIRKGNLRNRGCIMFEIRLPHSRRAILKSFGRMLASSLAMCAAVLRWGGPPVQAQNPNFHNAPASAKEMKNPYQGQRFASEKPLYHLRCARCHGENGEGSGNIPALSSGRAQSASDGELFWYITKGDVNNGMPSWSTLPRQQRWQIVTYVRVLGGSKPGSPRVRTTPAEAAATGMSAPPPKAPFTDYRFEKPGKIRKVTVKDLPAPFASASASNNRKSTRLN